MSFVCRRYSRQVWAILVTSACLSLLLLMVSRGPDRSGEVLHSGFTPPKPQESASIYQDMLVMQNYRRLDQAETDVLEVGDGSISREGPAQRAVNLSRSGVLEVHQADLLRSQVTWVPIIKSYITNDQYT